VRVLVSLRHLRPHFHLHIFRISRINRRKCEKFEKALILRKSENTEYKNTKYKNTEYKNTLELATNLSQDQRHKDNICLEG